MGFWVVSSLDAKNLRTRFVVMLVSDLLGGSWDLVLKIKSSSPISKPLCLTCLLPTQTDIKSLTIELIGWLSLLIYLVQCWRTSQMPRAWSKKTLSLSHTPNSIFWGIFHESLYCWALFRGTPSFKFPFLVPSLHIFLVPPHCPATTSLRLFCVSIIIWVSL